MGEAKDRIVPRPYLGTFCTGPGDRDTELDGGCQPVTYLGLKNQTPILFNIILNKE